MMVKPSLARRASFEMPSTDLLWGQHGHESVVTTGIAVSVFQVGWAETTRDASRLG